MNGKTTQLDDKPIANIAIYRLDIYRLLSLLWADEKITKNSILRTLSDEHCESEVNRLLILTAVVTRQILDNSKSKYKEIETKKCGKFWHSYPVGDSGDLPFRKACNIIIHATDIVVKTSEYYYIQGEESSSTQQANMYFKDKIRITCKGKGEEEESVCRAGFGRIHTTLYGT